MKCVICDIEPMTFRWLDYHGIGACGQCGAAYRIYHYEGDRRVDKPPALMFTDAWVELHRRYWRERRRNVDPGAYCMPGSSYDYATAEDHEEYDAWMEAHKEEWPAAVPA